MIYHKAIYTVLDQITAMCAFGFSELLENLAELSTRLIHTSKERSAEDFMRGILKDACVFFFCFFFYFPCKRVCCFVLI